MDFLQDTLQHDNQKWSVIKNEKKMQASQEHQVDAKQDLEASKNTNKQQEKITLVCDKNRKYRIIDLLYKMKHDPSTYIVHIHLRNTHNHDKTETCTLFTDNPMSLLKEYIDKNTPE
jgi:hypothetical protein